MAGPIIRAALNDVELRATAFGRKRSSTSSATKVCRAGESKAAAHPSRNAKIDVPQLDQTGDDQQSKPERQQPHGGLGAEQHLSPVEMIRDETGQGQQQDLRAELQPHHDTHRGRVAVRQFGEDDPVLRGALHPRSDIGHQRSRRPDPVVVSFQRTERSLQLTPHP
jgi:hypothetical protein